MNPRLVARITNTGQRFGPLAVASTRLHGFVNRTSRGRLGRRWFGAPVAVIETVGRKSGKRRSSPILYARDGDAYLVCAAAAGTRVPAWWLNLRASGAATIVVKGRRIPVRARVAEGEEHARLWPRYLEVYPAAAEYARFGDHEMPLLVLEPA